MGNEKNLNVLAEHKEMLTSETILLFTYTTALRS